MQKSAIASLVHVRHLLKMVTIPFLDRSGALGLANRFLDGERRLVLNYHNVHPAIFQTHAAFFRRHMEVVDVETFLSMPPGRRVRPLVALTFDDGYASFVNEIVPILIEYGLPAVWFVPTALVGTDEIFWFDRIRGAILQSQREEIVFQGRRWALRPWNRGYVATEISRIIKKADHRQRDTLLLELVGEVGEVPELHLRRFRLATRDQLRSLDSRWITIGSHSHTHPQLSQLSPDELVSELVLSKKLLEEWIDRTVTHFAFPSGDYDPSVIEAIQESGYAFAWTTESRLFSSNENPYRLPRIPIDDQASIGILRAKMTPLFYQLGVL